MGDFNRISYNLLFEVKMKVKINLDTDDYLILFLLLMGSIIAILGIYMVFVEVIDYLHGAISAVFQN